jgi:hypothetical protein
MDHHHWAAAGLAAACAAMWTAAFVGSAIRVIPASARAGCYALSAVVTILMGVRQMLRRESLREHDTGRLDRLDAELRCLYGTMERVCEAGGLPVTDGTVPDLKVIPGGRAAS